MAEVERVYSRTRSWLFAPGDSERKLEKVSSSGADIVIVDLEDAVAPEAKTRARGMAHEWLRAQPTNAPFQRWVRINALNTTLWRDDCAAVLPGRPHGLMVPKALGPDQLELLSAELTALEIQHGITPGSTSLLPLVSETPAAALNILSYAATPPTRLMGLTWGAEDLSVALGATRKRDSSGAWTDTFRLIRSQVLLAARAAGVLPIDTLHANFRDLSGLHQIATAAYADGFVGMLAIHPDQVAVINDAFSPTSAQLDEARAIVDAFRAHPGVGALQLNGRMLDQPHFEQAKRLLAQHQTA